MVTLCMGETTQRLADFSHPSLRRYADHINADFVVISNHASKHLPNWHAYWEKLQLFYLLHAYRRIIYLDTDCLVREDCPNLFELVPDHAFGAVLEGPQSRHKVLLDQVCADYRWPPIIESAPKYLNSGVMVLSRAFCHVLSAPSFIPENAYQNLTEQSLINYRVLKDPVPFTSLDRDFNGMKEPQRSKAYIPHFTAMSYHERVAAMRKTLNAWEKKGGSVAAPTS